MTLAGNITGLVFKKDTLILHNLIIISMRVFQLVCCAIAYKLYNRLISFSTTEHLSLSRCHTDHLQYRCCCGDCSSGNWHHHTYCWCPDWSLAVLLYQQAPITVCKSILTPTAAGSILFWGGVCTSHQPGGEDRPEGELGLWVHAEDWTETKWSLCACAALMQY